MIAFSPVQNPPPVVSWAHMPGTSFLSLISQTGYLNESDWVMLPNGAGFVTVGALRMVYALVRAGLIAEPGPVPLPDYASDRL